LVLEAVVIEGSMRLDLATLTPSVNEWSC